MKALHSVGALVAEGPVGVQANTGEQVTFQSTSSVQRELRDVVESLESVLPFHLTETREVLRDHGNMSSPSVLFALEKRLAANGPEDHRLWLTAFGAGFAAHALGEHEEQRDARQPVPVGHSISDHRRRSSSRPHCAS